MERGKEHGMIGISITWAVHPRNPKSPFFHGAQAGMLLHLPESHPKIQNSSLIQPGSCWDFPGFVVPIPVFPWEEEGAGRGIPGVWMQNSPPYLG